MTLSNQTKLAVAGAFNGTMLDDMFLAEVNLANMMVWQMEDYFNLNPESEQFNKDVVLGELKSATYRELMPLLAEIGYRAMPMRPGERPNWTLEGLLWHDFINKAPVDW